MHWGPVLPQRAESDFALRVPRLVLCSALSLAPISQYSVLWFFFGFAFLRTLEAVSGSTRKHLVAFQDDDLPWVTSLQEGPRSRPPSRGAHVKDVRAHDVPLHTAGGATNCKSNTKL